MDSCKCRKHDWSAAQLKLATNDSHKVVGIATLLRSSFAMSLISSSTTVMHEPDAQKKQQTQSIQRFRVSSIMAMACQTQQQQQQHQLLIHDLSQPARNEKHPAGSANITSQQLCTKTPLSTMAQEQLADCAGFSTESRKHDRFEGPNHHSAVGRAERH